MDWRGKKKKKSVSNRTELEHPLIAVLLVQHRESGTHSCKLMRPCKHQQYAQHLLETKRQTAQTSERRSQAASSIACSVPTQLCSVPPTVFGPVSPPARAPHSTKSSLSCNAGATAARSTPGRKNPCAPVTRRPGLGFTVAVRLSDSRGAFPFENCSQGKTSFTSSKGPILHLHSPFPSFSTSSSLLSEPSRVSLPPSLAPPGREDSRGCSSALPCAAARENEISC